MNPQTSEGLPSHDDLLPGSGTENIGATINGDLAASMSSQFHISFQGVSKTKRSHSMGNVVLETGVSEARSNSLSDNERAALFDGLRATSAMKENCEGAPDMSVIETALMKNPKMMFNLKRLQDGGAKLVVTGFQEGHYVEFADAAQNLDVRKQEAGLAGLTEQERNDAIETIVTPIADDTQNGSARAWLLSRLRRSDGVRGLNFAEALVYAVAHGGTLISHEAYDVLAKKDPSVYEDTTWTWYVKSLSDVMRSGIAPRGFRYGGRAYRDEYDADGRSAYQGGRVAGLRVQIA